MPLSIAPTRVTGDLIPSGTAAEAPPLSPSTLPSSPSPGSSSCFTAKAPPDSNPKCRPATGTCAATAAANVAALPAAVSISRVRPISVVSVGPRALPIVVSVAVVSHISVHHPLAVTVGVTASTVLPRPLGAVSVERVSGYVRRAGKLVSWVRALLIVVGKPVLAVALELLDHGLLLMVEAVELADGLELERERQPARDVARLHGLDDVEQRPEHEECNPDQQQRVDRGVRVHQRRCQTPEVLHTLPVHRHHGLEGGNQITHRVLDPAPTPPRPVRIQYDLAGFEHASAG
eukprot:1303345-Rhodomonas_salina.3